MGKKDKKKVKGAEKTAIKTEKKALSKLKRDLAAKGEDDIEKLIAEGRERDRKQKIVGEELCSQPSPRSGFSFCAHPDKEELLLFGGEYYNGITTVVYNDLYIYNIKKSRWSILHCIEKPPPRCSHQAVVLSQKGGQLWVFGGEFASPSRSNFYHYKDLWVFHFSNKTWEQIKAPGAPTARSGHRMVVSQKRLVVFGGFHESIRDYNYSNDVHIFDLETYQWSKIEPVGKCPSPRSGGQMAALMDGRILLYGGYSREKVKKDVDKGTAHTDMFYLQLDERVKPAKWKWVQIKPSGIPPSARSGFSMAVAANNHAYCFGGVSDEDPDEENLFSVFYSDLYLLELENGRWLPIELHRKDFKESKRRRRVKDGTEQCDDELEIMESAIPDKAETTYEDGIFSVKIGPQSTDAFAGTSACLPSETSSGSASFQPNPRMNASIVVKNGILYLYGGLYEEDKRTFTLSDFYSLDIHKLDEWHTIVPFSQTALEWIDSESESDSDDEESDVEMDDSADGDSEGMDTS